MSRWVPDERQGLPLVRVLGIPIHAIGVERLHVELQAAVARRTHSLFLHANVHAINLALRWPWLHELYNRADLVFCDGAGVIIGARILGHRIPERITYADWIWQLGALCEGKGYALFLLGGRPGIADRAAARLTDRFPRLYICGTMHGYFDKRLGGEENDSVLRAIRSSRPDVLLAAMGMPVQEVWLDQNRRDLDMGVALTAGAALDYASGELRRAPRWMTDRGLEWLGRLILEPRRLWRRYLLGNPAFLFRVLMERMGVVHYP
jgi:N-acetylglucosaminyldiphosphoundecaprenol N-acetyl-beta-D-mannosaminyltransferase